MKSNLLRKLLSKSPEKRIDVNFIRNSKWFKYFYETDASDEDDSEDLTSYNFSDPKIFQIFSMIKENNFDIEFFLSVYQQKISSYNNKKIDRKKKSMGAKIQYEYFEMESGSKIKETTKEHRIVHNIVESEIYSLENSTHSISQKPKKNKIILNSEQKRLLKREMMNDLLFSETGKPCLESILNQMISLCRCKFNQTKSENTITNSTVSKFYNTGKNLTESEESPLNKNDILVLKVLEKMNEFGFRLSDIKESLQSKKLDAIRASFRLIAQQILNGPN